MIKGWAPPGRPARVLAALRAAPRSNLTLEFLAMCAIMQHDPEPPRTRRWIESLNGHQKAEYPHLLAEPRRLRVVAKSGVSVIA
jgi:hypothetical protein